jgi:hypothetical protein
LRGLGADGGHLRIADYGKGLGEPHVAAVPTAPIRDRRDARTDGLDRRHADWQANQPLGLRHGDLSGAGEG